MGYLKSLYQLFPPAGSDEYISEEAGKTIISEVFNSHLSSLSLQGFTEYEEEFYAFRDVIRNNLHGSYSRGLAETLGNKKTKKQERDSWIRFNEDRLEAYYRYYDVLQDSLLKEIGHYPGNDTLPKALYYVFIEQETLLKETSYTPPMGSTDLQRSLSSPDNNLAYFKNRITVCLNRLARESSTTPTLSISLCESWIELQKQIKELFSNYISRIRPIIPPTEIIDRGLCWVFFTMKEVSILTSRFGNDDITYNCRLLGVSIRNSFLDDIKPKVYSFHTLTEQDFKIIYSYLKKYSKRYPVRFSEKDFLDAIYLGDYSKIYQPGVISNLVFMNKVLQTYAESPKWIESVAHSLGKKVTEINGSNGYTSYSLFIKNFPYKERILKQ